MESYKTVKLNNMADAFGVSIDFIDRWFKNIIKEKK